jgi:hypothetical protein
MRSSRPRSEAALLSLLFLGLGCGPSPYTIATDAYGKSISEGLSSFSPVFETAVELCYRDAELEHLQYRLENKQGGRPWSQKPRLGDVFILGATVKVEKPGTTELVDVSVRERCRRLDQADSLLRKGLVGLEAYARALSSAGSKVTINSERLGEMVKGSGDLATELSKNSTDTKQYTDRITPIGQALGRLTGVFTEAIVEKKLKETIQKTHPHVLAILEAARAYVGATRGEMDNVENRIKLVLNTVDQLIGKSLNPPLAAAAAEAPPAVSVPPKTPELAKGKKKEPPALVAASPSVLKEALEQAMKEALAEHERSVVARPWPSPPDVLALYDYAERERKEIAHTRKALSAFDAVLDDLQNAESDLKDCADGKIADEVVLDRVFTLAIGIVKEIETLKALASKKE